MELSETQKQLIACFKALKMDRMKIMILSLILWEPESAEEMMDWFWAHPKAKAEEAERMAVICSNKYQDKYGHRRTDIPPAATKQ